MEIAERHDLVVIEDCAESHGATVRGRMTGSLGDMACFSFYANKIITTGEGGMVMTDDDALAERLRFLRNLAFSQPRFLHEEAGFNFRMTGYQAAMGRVQLARSTRSSSRSAASRAPTTSCSRTCRGSDAGREGLGAQRLLDVCDHRGRGVPAERDELMGSLREAGIESRTFFCPMNLQPFLREQPGFRDVPCPVAERLWETGLYLPSRSR